MRFTPIVPILLTITALSVYAGDGTALDAISSLKTTCVKTGTSINCGTVGIGDGTRTSKNTGNKTIVPEKSVLVSDASNPSLSKLVVTNPPSKAKDMAEYVYGTASFTPTVAGESDKEYRAPSASSSATTIDKELQIWSWNTGSYAIQYRDVTSGSGKVAMAIPTTGNVNLDNGVNRGTDKTSNFIEPTNQPKRTVAINNSLVVSNTAQVSADSASGAITGSLTPLTSNALGENNNHQDADPTNPADPNHGGALYGTSGVTSTSGLYAFMATAPAPTGGTGPINDDIRGYISESGVFHAQ